MVYDQHPFYFCCLRCHWLGADVGGITTIDPLPGRFSVFHSTINGPRYSIKVAHIRDPEPSQCPCGHTQDRGPSNHDNLLGILIDTYRCELRLPLEKLEFTRNLVSIWKRRRSGKAADFKSFLGHLSHAATVIRQGRTFLRHAFEILAGAPFRQHFVHLDVELRADLIWWEQFLEQRNGTMFLRQHPSPTVHVYTDASGSYGCGGILAPSFWFNLQWPDSWSGVDIVVKELVPIVMAAALWGRMWYKSLVCFHSDNMAVVAILTSRTGRSPLVLHLLQCLFFYTACIQFDYAAEHIPGVLNTAADALSRNNVNHFLSLVPQAAQTPIPDAVALMLVTEQPDWGSHNWIPLFRITLPRQLHQQPQPLIAQQSIVTYVSVHNSNSPFFHCIPRTSVGSLFTWLRQASHTILYAVT